jgi:hypothetical protein
MPKTHDQPEEEANSKRFRPYGNNASTGISRVPPIRQTARGLMNGRQHTPHMVAGTTTTSVGIKHSVKVRTGQPHPAANHRRAGVRPDLEVKVTLWSSI